MESDQLVKNLIGVSSCSPALFSRSKGTCISAFALPSGKAPFAFSRCLDRGKTPMLIDGFVIQSKLELSGLGEEVS